MPTCGAPPPTEAKGFHLCASVRGPLGLIVAQRAAPFSEAVDLPGEQPRRFNAVTCLKAVKAQGLAISWPTARGRPG